MFFLGILYFTSLNPGKHKYIHSPIEFNYCLPKIIII